MFIKGIVRNAYCNIVETAFSFLVCSVHTSIFMMYSIQLYMRSIIHCDDGILRHSPQLVKYVSALDLVYKGTVCENAGKVPSTQTTAHNQNTTTCIETLTAYSVVCITFV